MALFSEDCLLLGLHYLAAMEKRYLSVGVKGRGLNAALVPA